MLSKVKLVASAMSTTVYWPSWNYLKPIKEFSTLISISIMAMVWKKHFT